MTTDLVKNLAVHLVVVEEELGPENVVDLAICDLLLSQASQLSVLVKGQHLLSLLKFGLCRFKKTHTLFSFNKNCSTCSWSFLLLFWSSKTKFFKQSVKMARNFMLFFWRRSTIFWSLPTSLTRTDSTGEDNSFTKQEFLQIWRWRKAPVYTYITSSRSRWGYW